MTTPKPLTVWIQTNCGEFLKRWECQTTLPASCKTCIQIKKQQLELNMEQQTRSKLGKEYIKAVYAEYIMWNARLDESQAGIKFARRNINNLRCVDDTTLMEESEEELKCLWMKGIEESEKIWLNAQHSEN